MNIAPLTDDEVVIERHDLEMMRRWHLWSYGSFLPLKHRIAVNEYGVFRTGILFHCINTDAQKEMYVFLPEVNMYSIPVEFWTDLSNYRSGGETLLFEIIIEGWIVA